MLQNQHSELSKILEIKENEINNIHKKIENIHRENEDLKEQLKVNIKYII